MSDQHPEPESLDGTAEARARSKLKRLWQHGDLFHVTTRYPRRGDAPRVDRLAGILRNGLVSPARCADGSVRSDLQLVVTGCSVPYDSVIFLHRFGPVSFLYTICQPGRFAVFLAPDYPVLTEAEMGPHWVVLSQDEVYVRDRIEVERLIGVAIHPADADAVLGEFLADFRRLHLPLYDYEGKVVWPPG